MQSSNKGAWRTLATVLLLPLISMMIIPLYDTSEPRYAEIARIMAESGDWITPWFSPDVPFWGKPPLSFWAQALSMKAFGFNEFAARFPSWLCLLLSNAILLKGLTALRGTRVALWTCIIYSTCALAYISSGAVLTDPFLALGITLSMMSFAMVAHRSTSATTRINSKQLLSPTTQNSVSSWWQYGFFLGLAIGLLAKGPLAAVVSIAPVIVWSALNRKSIHITHALPWIKGLILTAALTLPWYILAELKTPGFLDYFIVGEHFRRFLDPGWAGDLYGTAHRRPYGMIWLFWLQASFPWGLLALAAMAGAIRNMALRRALHNTRKDSLSSYWLVSALLTPLFFTLSANILWTYVLPSLAGMSVLLAIFANELYRLFNLSERRLLITAGLVPSVLLILTLIAWINPDLRNTERGLISYVAEQGEPALPLFYLSEPPSSARFYSSGNVGALTPDELPKVIAVGVPFYLAVRKDKQETVVHILGKELDKRYSNKRYTLVKVQAPSTRP